MRAKSVVVVLVVQGQVHMFFFLGLRYFYFIKENGSNNNRLTAIKQICLAYTEYASKSVKSPLQYLTRTIVTVFIIRTQQANFGLLKEVGNDNLTLVESYRELYTDQSPLAVRLNNYSSFKRINTVCLYFLGCKT